MSCKLLKLCEKISTKFSYCGRIYHKLFYSKLIRTEVELADLKPGAKVIHIGSGPFPMTAIELARQGHQVVGVDIDEKAIKQGQKIVDKLDLRDQISLILKSEEFDLADYDAIWVSLNVIPRLETIKDLSNKLKPKQKLIYRNPRGILKTIYQAVSPLKITTKEFIVAKSILAKEVILIKG